VSLSYKLLRSANSAIFKRRNEISTIKQALVILGSGDLKRFIGLMFAVTANPNKPSELINLAMTRAKFCELASQDIRSQLDISIAFLTGLLSMIDAILDEEMATVLEKLPLSQEIKDPLLTKKGVMASLISLVQLIEQAEWEKTTLIIDELKLDKDKVVEYYNQAVAWADEQTQVTA
jgi:EAL and modified HD-GYP domain-containing signal transduction protein